jgi:hypothetical protein
MSSGTQVDLDWAGTDLGADGTGANGAAAGVGTAGVAGPAGTYLSDEEILGIEPVGAVGPTHHSVILSARTEDSRRGEARNLSSIDGAGEDATKRDSSGKDGPQNDSQRTFAEQMANSQMPEWMRTATSADPAHGAEAQALWREHQEFRAAFSSAREARAVAEETRAIKELLPGGVKDVVSLREATASVDRIDAALFSGDARAQSEVVAELARANPAAFRSMFAEAARVLAGMGVAVGDASAIANAGAVAGRDSAVGRSAALANSRQDAGATSAANTTHPLSQELMASQSSVAGEQSPRFDPAAYASFERATNDAVARDVRGSIGDTLARVMPEGVAEGAARRIGEDIFSEVHRALASDRALSEQVAAVLRDRRFDGVEQQRVTALLAGRAKQLVPSVARRVIGEWTSTVLNTARSKAARQAVAASRVDIAAAGGSLDSMPLRAMSSKEVNYASMSDEEILGI